MYAKNAQADIGSADRKALQEIVRGIKDAKPKDAKKEC